MSNRLDNFDGEQQHPPHDQFLLYVDGELPVKETARWESHLDACWSCRVRVAKIEQTITEIVEFEETVSQFQSSRTNHGWGNFDSRLNAIKMEAGRQSIKTRIFGFWRNPGHLRSIALPIRIAIPSLAILVIVAILYQFVAVPTVSAAELLRLSIEAHAENLKDTAQPVLHQRIRIVRTVRFGTPPARGGVDAVSADGVVGGDRVSPAILEIWNDTVNSRVKISSPPYEGGVGFSSPPARGGVAAVSADGVVGADGVVLSSAITDLQSILRTNGMNEHRPLSATSYQAWTNSLTGKSEEVLRENETLTIHTVAAEPVAIGRISEARFSVRANDYHPTALYLRARTGEGEQEFELAEQDFEIVSLKDIDPAIWSEPGAVATGFPTAPKTDPSTSEPGAPSIDATGFPTNANIAPASPNMPAATTAVEIEVLDRLHQIGADITEQLNVTRTADGRLLVEGLVETAGRKAQILNALSPVTNNPALRINIRTIEEATRALQSQKQQATPGPPERVEVEKGASAVDPELRAHFERNGGNADEQIRAFASRVINRSKGAAFQASALNRMANRFTADQLKTLDPEARSKYLGILKGYATAVRRETVALRGELRPVFGDVSDGADESVTSDADLIASARRLFDLASTNDRVIRSAFTISSGGMSVSAIKTPQFRRSLGNAESLAAAIERAR